MSSTLFHAPPECFGRWVTRAIAAALIAALIAGTVVAAYAWAAWRRAADGGIALGAAIDWSSVWLWPTMAAVAGLAWGAALAWSARYDQARLEAQFGRDGAP